ncbi:MAG TPA: hypothetical protein VGX25_18225 [Actinophytocola sp.]|uniref:hypothetical protein n=1 Tax=Actinophytocola sp. TaxID=1872138 RepID=UPI002DDDBD1D|nr:hypothetical protein [Actinophytocola sp.]HEV2781324.1 hypothetical protein [Actinophytocola sp.]
MTVRSRAVLAAVACVVLLASACEDRVAPPTPAQPASTAPPASDPRTRLARQLAPAVWLAENERNFPMDASRFIANSDLWFDHGDGCADDEPVAREVSERGLAGDEYRHPGSVPPTLARPHATVRCQHDERGPHYQPNTSDQEPGTGKGFYLDLDDAQRRGDGPNAPVYWQFVGEDGGAGAFVYWLFYGYNDFDINNHEGDWERVAVRVDGERPTGVTFWRHNEPSCSLPWERVEKAGNRPVTYSASGSHGSYHRQGTFPLATALIADDTSPGTPWHTWDNLRAVEKEPWWGYRGLWGVTGPEGFSGPAGPNPDRHDKIRSDALTSLPCAIDPRFIGTWVTREPVNQPTSDKVYHARLTLRDGAIGDTVGSSFYPGLECSGPLTLIESAADKLVVREKIDSEPKHPCVDEVTITLTLSGDTLLYSFTDPGTGTGTATLFRE